MADIAGVYWGAPPIARTVATAIFVTSVAVYTGMISGGHLFFHWQLLLLFPPGLHRFFTSFLITSPQLGVLLDTYFCFSYLSQLESNTSKFPKKENLIWYLIFVGGVVVLINQVLTGAGTFLQALLIAMCYTSTQDQRGQTAHFYILTIPAQLMPYCLLIVQLLFPGGWYLAMIGATGILAAHLYDFLTRIYPEFGNGPNLIPTPWFLTSLMETPRIRDTVYGSAMAPQQTPNGPQDTQRSGRTGPLPDSWRTRGRGQRLG